MRKPELLAPAGNIESLYAAVNAGCDAVYLAGNLYGARSYANNFSNEELIEAINYCHLLGVKVYVTVNTLIYEDEVDNFLDYVGFIHRNNVDAIIVQDLGMCDLIHKTYPNLEIHASTQMHIHNLDGVLMAKKLGIKRVVMARETSIDTLKKIKENTDMPLEVFVHGALCISYSGQCLMSSLIGNRSGNRGSCTGCCRLPYDLYVDNNKVNEDKYLLSTKDLNTLDHINELIDIEIDSLKIEGRMKSPEYVYVAVKLYRQAIDSYFKYSKVIYDKNLLKSLKFIFNREYTKGFLFNEQNSNIINSFRPNHLGIKIGKVIKLMKNQVLIKLNEQLNINDGIRIISKNDTGAIVTRIIKNGKLVKSGLPNDEIIIDVKGKVNINDIVLKTYDYNLISEINKEIQNERRKVFVDIKIEARLNDYFKVSINDGNNSVKYISKCLISKAINNPTSKEAILKQMSKLGNSIYKINNIDILLDNNIFIQLSELNNIRREVIELLNNKRLYSINYKKDVYTISVNNFEIERNINICTNNVNNHSKYNYIYSDTCGNNILKIPRVVNDYSIYNRNTEVLIGELGGINYFTKFNTDFSFNVTNSYTVALLHSLGANIVTLSYELNDNQIKNIIDGYHKRYNKHPNLEVIIKGYEEAMISKYNILNAYNIDSNEAVLKDIKNRKYKVVVKNNLTYIYNSISRNLTTNYYDMGINNIRINEEIIK